MNENQDYGVPELADALGVSEPTARIKLRNAKVEKVDGGIYGWNKRDFDAVVKKLKEVSSSPAKKPAKKAVAKKSPAKAAKQPAKKAAKKAASKSPSKPPTEKSAE